MDFVNNKLKIFNGFALKIIAALAMLSDHAALIFLGSSTMAYQIMRGFGRISFPLICFLIVEGFVNTSSKRKYCIRLGLVAVLSEIPYNLMMGSLFYPSGQNPMIAVFLGYLSIWGLYLVTSNSIVYSKKIIDHTGKQILDIILEFLVIVIPMVLAYYSGSAYSYGAVILIIGFYLARGSDAGKICVNLIFNCLLFGFGSQWFGALSAVPIFMYNGRDGAGKKMRLGFYIFYPLHILVLLFVKWIVG